MQSTTIIAFDQHAATTVAAVLLPGQRTPALHPLTSDLPTIRRFVQRLQRQGAVRCCYEAGPCGFELQRALTAHGIPCDVIAPALIPRRPGDRIKTDRRDAGQLAVLYRADALTAIHIPTEQEEAVRDLLRCREDIRADLLRARHRLSKFLLRHGRRFTGTKKAWSKRHDAWLRAQTWPLPALEQTHSRRISARSTKRRAAPRGRARSRGPLLHARAAARRVAAPALLPRHRRPHRADHRGGARRPATLRDRAEHDGLRRPGPVGALERQETRPGRHHQDRQRASPPRPRRSGVALSPSSASSAGAARPPARRTGRTRSRARGPRSSDCIGRIDGSRPAASPSSRWSPRSPASSPASSGRP